MKIKKLLTISKRISLGNILLFLYLFTISWSNIFAFSVALPLHLIFTILILFYLLFLVPEKKYKRTIFKFEEIFLFIFFFISIISGIINFNPKTVRYILAYFSIFFFEFYLTRLFIYNFDQERVLKYLMYGVVFMAFFSICEVFTLSVFSFDIKSLLPHLVNENAIFYKISNSKFIWRAYGFTFEPTYLAFYYNTLGTLSVLYICKYINSGRMKILLISLILIGLILTFSAAGWVFITLALLIYAFWNAQKINNWLFATFVIVIGIIIVLYANGILDSLLVKVNVFRTDYQANGRMNKWRMALHYIKENWLLGIGPGGLSYKDIGSPTNFYLFIGTEMGLFALLSFLIYLTITFIRILKSSLDTKWFYLVAFTAGVLHYLVISIFYYSFLWLTINLFIIHSSDDANRT